MHMLTKKRGEQTNEMIRRPLHYTKTLDDEQSDELTFITSCL